MGRPEPLEGIPLTVKVLRWVGNTLFHQVLAVVTISAIWYGCVNYTAKFSWHVILSTIGYIPLMAEGILLFAGDNVWSQELDRKKKYWIHGILLFLGTVALTAGIALEIHSKGNRAHFTSKHGLTGIISMGLVLGSVLLGLIAANTSLFNRVARPVWFKFFHNFIGIAGYVIGVVSLIYGYYTGWFRRQTSEEARTAISIATGLVTAWSLYAAFLSCYNQIKTIFRR